MQDSDLHLAVLAFVLVKAPEKMKGLILVLRSASQAERGSDTGCPQAGGSSRHRSGTGPPFPAQKHPVVPLAMLGQKAKPGHSWAPLAGGAAAKLPPLLGCDLGTDPQRAAPVGQI